MDPVLRPVGRESTATYWRRRALLLVAVLLALFLGSRACAGNGSDGQDGALRRGTGTSLSGPGTAEPTSTAKPSGGPGSTSEPTGQPSGGSGQPTGQPTDEATGVVAGGVVPGYCQDSNIKVSVKPTTSTFQPTQDAKFRLSIVNVGAGPCRYEVGPRGWEATVESGTTRIWNSDDCAVAEASRLQTLQPDEPVTVTIVWDRIRSKQGCPSGQPAAAAGTYTLVATAGNVSSQKVSFVLAD